MSVHALKYLKQPIALLVLLVSAHFALSPAQAQNSPECSPGSINADDVGLVRERTGRGDGSDSCRAAAEVAPTTISTANDHYCGYAHAEGGAGWVWGSAARNSCPPRPVSALATNHCRVYTQSSLHRPRRNSLTIGPNDDWQALIEGAEANTEIRLLDGEYELTNYAVVLAKPNITIRGASGDRKTVRIVGQGYGPGSEGFMVLAAGITIADLTMSAIRNHAISIKPASGAARTYIYNVHLFNVGTQHIKGSSGDESVGGVVACSSIGYTRNGAKGDYLGAIDVHNAVNWTIRDNYIYNINGDGSGCEVDIDCGTYIYGAPAIYLWNGARGSVVERNTVVNSDRGIALGLGRGHDGGVIRNNFIYRPAAGDAGIELWTASDLLVEHNTVILGGDYPGAIEYRESNNIIIRNNLISVQPWDRGSNSGVVARGNIGDATASDFVAPGDPHLRSDSQAIGAGVASNLSTDIDGDSRSGRRDVGADQYTEDQGDDGDGVNNDQDRCPATPSGALVNRYGCSLAQLVPCRGPRLATNKWNSHRQYVGRIAVISMTFVRQRVITNRERRVIIRRAFRARCGR